MLIPTTILTAAAAAAGGELDYVAFTADVTISATTEGTANTVVTGSSVVYDGSTAVTAEFFTPQLSNGVGAGIAVVMLLDTTVLGISFCQATELPVVVTVRTTPSAGSHAFVVKAYRTSANGIIHAGTGGSATNLPGFIRVTR